MALKIQSTKVTETAKGFVVEMILSDGSDLERAANVIQLRATLDTADIDQRSPRLAKLQEVALCHVRDAVQDEIDRLRSDATRKP